MEPSVPSNPTSGPSTGSAPSAHEQAFWLRVFFLGKQCKVEFDEEEIQYLDSVLSPLGYENLCRAMDEIIRTRDSRDPFPSIKDIQAVLNPKMDPDAEATEVVMKLGTAIGRIGPYRSQEFKEFVGPIGWSIVESSGGIQTVCAMTDRELGVNRAQWKGMALSMIQRGKVGPTLPQIEKKESGPGLLGLGSILKQIEEKKP